MPAEFCEMGSTQWLDSLVQDKHRMCIQSSEILQSALQLAAARDRKVEEFIGNKRNKIVSVEKIIAQNKLKVLWQETEAVKLNQKIIERKSAVTRIMNETKSLEEQKKKLSEDFERFHTTLRDQQNALVMANGYFKDRLECYIELDNPNDDTFIIAFFSSEKKVSYEYFVTIKWNTENNTWTVEEMSPKLPSQPEIAKKLARTGDIQGFLYHVRKQYLSLRAKFI